MLTVSDELQTFQLRIWHMKQWVNLSACITLKLLVTDSTLFHNTVGMLHSLEHVCVCVFVQYCYQQLLLPKVKP